MRGSERSVNGKAYNGMGIAAHQEAKGVAKLAAAKKVGDRPTGCCARNTVVSRSRSVESSSRCPWSSATLITLLVGRSRPAKTGIRIAEIMAAVGDRIDGWWKRSTAKVIHRESFRASVLHSRYPSCAAKAWQGRILLTTLRSYSRGHPSLLLDLRVRQSFLVLNRMEFKNRDSSSRPPAGSTDAPADADLITFVRQTRRKTRTFGCEAGCIRPEICEP